MKGGYAPRKCVSALEAAGILPFTELVSRIAHRRVGARLLLASPLLGCPQLLDDDFDLSVLTLPADSGVLTCSPAACPAPPRDGGPGTDAAPDGSSPDGAPSDASVPDAASDPRDAAPDTGTPPSCTALTLYDTVHAADENCLGVYGWNDVATDAATSMSVSYSAGDVCFSGTIGDTGWGAVYNLTFAGDEDDPEGWNAEALGVTGFEVVATGPEPPPELEVIYTVQGGVDYCRALTQPASASVPFDSAHPGCSTDSTAATPDASRLTVLRLHFPARSDPYDLDFCLQLRPLW